MSSIQLRLQLALLASAGVIFLVLLVAGSWLARQLGEDFVESRLVHDAESLLAALDLTNRADPALDPRLANPMYRRAFSGHYFIVNADDRELRSPSLWDSDFSVPPLHFDGRRISYLGGPQGQELLVLSVAYSKGDVPVSITVAEDITPLIDDIALFRTAFVVLALTVFAGVAALQFAIVRRAFGRLDGVRRDLRRLAAGKLEKLPEDAPAELRPLVVEINRLLVLLGQRVDRSRQALGDLAHGLKGPLNLQMQILRGKELDHDPALRDQLLDQAERIESLMSRELRRAQTAGAATPGQRFSLQRDLPDLIDTVKRIHADRDLAFEIHTPEEFSVSLDREDVLEMLGNLLDNAAKWASKRVICRATVAVGATHLGIEDDGPGCSEEALPTLTARDVRLDERVEGHGLGLAIAADVAEHYGGRLEFDRSPELGGLGVRVILPDCGTHAST